MEISKRTYDAVVGLDPRGSKRSPHDLAAFERRIFRAARLARRGDFQTAETLLAPLPLEGPLAPIALDLKAKIFAQQGRFVEAELCWIEAIRQSPGNPSYRKALECVARRPNPLWLMRWLLALFLIVLTWAMLIRFVDRRVGEMLAAPATPVANTAAAQQDLLGGQRDIVKALADLREQLHERKPAEQPLEPKRTKPEQAANEQH